jgi:LysM repeat protein
MRTRKSRAPVNNNLRNFLIGCAGFTGLGVCLLVVVGAVAISRIPPVAEQLPVNAVPILVNLTLPTSGMNVSANNPTSIRVDAIGSQSLATIQLWIDGIPVDARSAPPDSTQTSANFAWTPRGFGSYTLVARAVDSQGHIGNSNLVYVNAQPPQQQIVVGNVIPTEGQTLANIAESVGTTADELVALNPGLDPNQPLPADQPVNVPVALPPPATDADCDPDNPVAPCALSPDVPVIPEDPGQPPVVVPPLPEVPQPPPGDLTLPAPIFVPNPAQFWLSINFPQFFGNALPPSAPQLAADTAGCDVNLYITDTASNEMGFFVYRLFPQSLAFERIAAIDANNGGNAYKFTDSGVYGKLQYYVSAFNDAGETPGNYAVAKIEDVACAKDEQKTLGIENAELSPSQPMDKVYCYASLGGGPWSRLPFSPDTFIFPNPSGKFDLSSYLNVITTPPPLTDTELALECWGWRGGALQGLGMAKQMIGPGGVGNPLQLNGGNFVLNGQLIKQPIGGFNFPLPAPIPFGGGGVISPPTKLHLAKSIEECQSHSASGSNGCQGFDPARVLVWDWNNSTCSQNGEGEDPADCPYIKDVTGFRFYHVTGKLLYESQDTLGKNFTEPDTYHNRCYYVTAYNANFESAPSNTFCITAEVLPDPLPTKVIAAPFNLKVTNDGKECTDHLMGLAKLFFGPLCAEALQQSHIVVVWDWKSSACFPSQGEAPQCENITDIDGFNVYVSVLNVEVLFDTIDDSSQTVAILLPGTVDQVQFVNTCVTVRAFKGSVESPASNEVCVNATNFKPPQTFQAGALKLVQKRPYYDHHWDSDSFWCPEDEPFISPIAAPPNTGELLVGYAYNFFPGTEPLPCWEWQAEFHDGVVTYDLSQISGTITEAVMGFSMSQGSYHHSDDLTADNIISGGKFIAGEHSDPQSCARELYIYRGVLPASPDIWSGDFYQALPQSGNVGPLTAASLAPGGGSGSGEITAASLAGGKVGSITVDVTSAVQEAVNKGSKSISFVLSGHDPVWLDNSRYRNCLSYYFNFDIEIKFAP